MSIATPLSPNRLLAALPEDEYRRVARQLRPRTFRKGASIFRRGDAMDLVFFPHEGACSLMRTIASGRSIEIGLVGREGMVDHMAALGAAAMTCDVIAQIPPVSGDMMRLRALLDEVQRAGRLATLLNDYTVARGGFVAANAACNALHSGEQRAARWLLLTADRVGSQFKMSQAYLGIMLGVRRPTASVVASGLQDAGFIRYRRARMEILNRTGLEGAACECYPAMQRVFAASLPAGPALSRD